MSRNSTLLLLIPLSLILHLLLFLLGTPGRPEIPTEQSVGIGLIQRPLAQFSRMERGNEQAITVRQTSQAAITTKPTPAVPVKTGQAAPVVPRRPQSQKTVVGLLRAGKSSQSVTPSVAQVHPVSQLVEAVDSPVEPLPTVLTTDPSDAPDIVVSALVQKVGAVAEVLAQPDIQADESVRFDFATASPIESAGADPQVVADVNNVADEADAAAGRLENRLVGTAAGDLDAGHAATAGDNGFSDALPYYDRNPRPVYPEIARRRGLEGTVLLEVLVQADGQVEKTSLQQSTGFRSLDRAALKAVRRWQFKPATLLGLPVASRVVVPINFVLHKN